MRNVSEVKTVIKIVDKKEINQEADKLIGMVTFLFLAKGALGWQEKSLVCVSCIAACSPHADLE
ncbi:hypothetical protein ACE1TI_06835 [Alteribacillus sp. JSM 102045]|uniref:hypothetical protein n=1 Tax=Alteribacillus sp. JSM 102045 TaxID=1562101 RepID=UPI0035BF36B3